MEWRAIPALCAAGIFFTRCGRNDGDFSPMQIAASSFIPVPQTAMPARLDVRAGLPLRSTRFRASRRTASFALSRPERRIPF